MRLGIRIIACVIMMAVALTMVVFTAADFREAQTRGYTLREYEGNVAVFGNENHSEPISVTDIELASLRQADRDKISAGISISGEGELQALLEDLGS